MRRGTTVETALLSLETLALLQPWGDQHSFDALLTELDCIGMLARLDTLIRQKGGEVPDEGEIEEAANTRDEHGSPWLRGYEAELTAIFLQDYWDRMQTSLAKFRFEMNYSRPDVTRAINELDAAIDGMRVLDQDVKKETKARIAEIMKAGFDKGSKGQNLDSSYVASHSRLMVQDGLWESLGFYLREFFYRFVAPKVRKELEVVFDEKIVQKVTDTRKVLELLANPSYVTAYMAIMANVAAQRSYNYGFLTAIQARGVRVFRLVAVIDNRTSDICRALNGTEFFVSDALRLIERASNPQIPTAATTVTPWLRAETLEPMSVQQLVAAGVMVPPFHADCRTHLEEVKASI